MHHDALIPDIAADLARWDHGGGFSLHGGQTELSLTPLEPSSQSISWTENRPAGHYDFLVAFSCNGHTRTGPSCCGVSPR